MKTRPFPAAHEASIPWQAPTVDDRTGGHDAALPAQAEGGDEALGSEFTDVTLLVRKWNAARNLAGDLPLYEDLALGGLGRFADEIGVVRSMLDNRLMVLRAGPLFERIVGRACRQTALAAFPAAFQTAISAAIARASERAMPDLHLYRAVVDGLVASIEIVVLPMASRWQGRFFLVFMRAREHRINLAELLTNSTRDGILAISLIEGDRGRHAEFSILSANEGAARFLDRPVGQMKGRRLSEILDGVGLKARIGEFSELVRGRDHTTFELEYTLRGEPMSLQVGVVNAGDVLTVSLTDIRALKARETHLRTLFDDNPVPMFVRCRRSRAFLKVNAAALELYGCDRAAFLSRTYGDIDLEAENTRLVRLDGGPLCETASRHRRLDGTVIDVIEYARPIEVNGEPAILSTIVDVTERKRAERRIAFLAHHDPLTQLVNRTLFANELERAIARLAAENEPFTVVSIDLNDFKLVNDTLGHDTGDQLLKSVAERLKSLVRKHDVVARLGGDEFAILLPAAHAPEPLAAIAERIIDSLSQPHLVQGNQVRIGASVGIARAPDDAATGEEILKCADLALYRAKAQHKTRPVCFFEPDMDQRHRERRELEMDLKSALRNREFVLHYQPIFSVDTGRLSGFEALLRWHHRRRGMVSPAAFIPLAEETGLIAQIGAQTLLDACTEAAGWPDPLVVAVNVSPVQFQNSDLVGDTRRALELSGLAPHRLEMEITESVLLDSSSNNLEVLTALKQMGVRIALDDFGTGYSSMGYLTRFPFDRIKIDQSFVNGVDSRHESLAIVRAIVGLSASLGIKTTAEGVETAAQLEVLRAERCGELQGFLFSRPVPKDALAGIISPYFREAPKLVAVG